MTERDEQSSELFERAIDATRSETHDGLDVARREAVFAAVVEQTHHRGAMPWVWAAGALAATAAVALVFFFGTPVENMTSLAPMAVVYREGSVVTATGQVVTEQTTADELTQLRVAAKARVDLQVPGEANVVVQGPAQVSRDRTGFVMNDGVAAFSVEPHEASNPFVVRVGSERVVVHGTRFDVHAVGGHVVAVHVEEGHVAVETEGEVVDVIGGEEHIRDGAKTTSIVSSLSDAWWRSTAANTYVYVETTPRGALVRIDDNTLGHAPVLVRWPLGEHHLRAELKGHDDAMMTVELGNGRTTRVRLQLMPTVATAEVTPPSDRKPRRRVKAIDPWAVARRLLRQKDCAALDKAAAALFADADGADEKARARMLSAECALRSGDQARALSAYREIAKDYDTTTSGESAMFEIAKILADGRQTKPALAAFEAYLGRHANGRFAEPAAMRRCELLVTSKRLVDAKTCLANYRTRFAKGLRIRQANLLYAELLRREGNCQEAVTVFAAVLSQTPTKVEAERARYRIAQCHKADDKKRGAAIEAYLRHHADGPHADEVRGWQR